MPKTFDTEHTELPVCPHCGREHVDWWDGPGASEEAWNGWCEACSKPFRTAAHRTITFTTTKLPESDR